MPGADWIPGVSQTKSLVQLICFDVDGALETQKNFCQECPVASQITSSIQLIAGDREGALETQKRCLDTINNVADATPVIGHIKGGIHYALGDQDGGHRAMNAASRTSVIIASGTGAGLASGGIGSIPAGIAAGAAYDVAATAITHKPQGLVAAARKVIDNPTSGNILDMVIIPVYDSVGIGAGVNPILNTSNSLSSRHIDTERSIIETNIEPIGKSQVGMISNDTFWKQGILNDKPRSNYHLLHTKALLHQEKNKDLNVEYNSSLKGTEFWCSIPKKLEIFNDEISIVGIDLGTTRCCAAVNRHKGIETVALDNIGERLLPSYVSYGKEKEKCGRIVVNELQENSKSTIYDAKRIIGKSFENVLIDKNWPFKIINEDDKVIIQLESSEGAIKKSPEEVAAVLLKHIKQKVKEFQNKEINEVVITIPAAFGDNEKEATCIAAKLAGWEIVHLLPEPVAAAIAYFVDRPIPNRFKMLLFDFGGGTLDICVFDVNFTLLHIICKGGDTCLGGRDFDNILFNYFSDILKDQHETDINLKNKSKYRLMQKCYEIKHTFLDVSDFDSNREGTIEITRHEFDTLSVRILNKIKETVMRTLSLASYTSMNIDKVLLVGGSSRIPAVKTLLQEMFSRSEHHYGQNPDEVVAMGAAYYAYEYKTKIIQQSNQIIN